MAAATRLREVEDLTAIDSLSQLENQGAVVHQEQTCPTHHRLLVPPMARIQRLFSWNVNGLRACAKKGFLDWLVRSDADYIGIQEVRARVDQLPASLISPEGYWGQFVSAARDGYSGVGLYARSAPHSTETALGQPRFDSEGRLQIARFGRLVVANTYFPNGSGQERDNSRVPFKLDFYRALFTRLQRLRRAGLRILVVGDFNTAHQELDLARPRDNQQTSGFLAEERAEFQRWTEAGWVDTFRHFEPGGGHYTWWSQRFGVRARNVGWRIDYVLASPSAMPFVRRAWHQPEVMGSDHCPIAVEFDQEIGQR
jgi:exodeoxyribonuclease-3